MEKFFKRGITWAKMWDLLGASVMLSLFKKLVKDYNTRCHNSMRIPVKLILLKRLKGVKISVTPYKFYKQVTDCTACAYSYFKTIAEVEV